MPVKNRFAEMLPEITEWRRDFHTHPELLFEVRRTAAKVADFLILNRQCPRSLVTSVRAAMNHLTHLGEAYGTPCAAQDAGRGLLAILQDLTVDEVFEEGLHEFLERFVREVSVVTAAVTYNYLSGEVRQC